MYRGFRCAICCDTRAGKALRWLIYMCVLILLYTCPDSSASQARPRLGASFKTTRGSRALRSSIERSTSAGAPPPALSPRCQIFLTHTHTHTHTTHTHTHTQHTRVHVCVCMYIIYTYIYVYVCMYIIYTCMYNIYMYIYIHITLYLFVCMYMICICIV
jgi:hypothetical protein